MAGAELAGVGMAGAGVAGAGVAGLAAAPDIWVLTFELVGQEHAVPVGDVIEVVRMVAVTPLPGGLPWVVGVLNYRGRVIPVVDARARLGMPRRPADLDTPIIVVAAGARAAGLVVDRALEVLALPAGALEPPERLGAAGTGVTGVARHGRRLLVLLDTALVTAGGEVHVAAD